MVTRVYLLFLSLENHVTYIPGRNTPMPGKGRRCSLESSSSEEAEITSREDSTEQQRRWRRSSRVWWRRSKAKSVRSFPNTGLSESLGEKCGLETCRASTCMEWRAFSVWKHTAYHNVFMSHPGSLGYPTPPENIGNPNLKHKDNDKSVLFNTFQI